jgi:hypothetical protein
MHIVGRTFSAIIRGTVEIAASKMPGNIIITTDSGVITAEDQILDVNIFGDSLPKLHRGRQ